MRSNRCIGKGIHAGVDMSSQTVMTVGLLKGKHITWQSKIKVKGDWQRFLIIMTIYTCPSIVVLFSHCRNLFFLWFFHNYLTEESLHVVALFYESPSSSRCCTLCVCVCVTVKLVGHGSKKEKDDVWADWSIDEANLFNHLNRLSVVEYEIAPFFYLCTCAVLLYLISLFSFFIFFFFWKIKIKRNAQSSD